MTELNMVQVALYFSNLAVIISKMWQFSGDSSVLQLCSALSVRYQSTFSVPILTFPSRYMSILLWGLKNPIDAVWRAPQHTGFYSYSEGLLKLGNGRPGCLLLYHSFQPFFNKWIMNHASVAILKIWQPFNKDFVSHISSIGRASEPMANITWYNNGPKFRTPFQYRATSIRRFRLVFSFKHKRLAALQ